MTKVKIGRTTNRQRGYRTPTPADSKCDHFEERFIGWGARNDRTAICEHPDPHHMPCDYLHVTQDGTPLCLRYWYGPGYEVQESEPPSKELKPVPYIEDSMQDDPNHPGDKIPTHPQFFSKQYEDTHEKIFGIVDGKLGWHSNI